MLPIITALRKGAERLARLKVPLDAPPAFLLDANWRGEGRKIEPCAFDNRSISFTTDFPSANFFESKGIEHAILVQKNRVEPPSDLVHSPRRWQDAGSHSFIWHYRRTHVMARRHNIEFGGLL